jgi:hypothetical protein
MEVLGPKCNERSSTLTSQEGLVSLLGAERMRSHLVVAVAMGPALRAGTRLLRNSVLRRSSSLVRLLIRRPHGKESRTGMGGAPSLKVRAWCVSRE